MIISNKLTHKLAESLKNQGVAKIFASPIQIGENEADKIGPKSIINLNFFLSHRDEILAMTEQVKMIRSFLTA